MFRKQALAIPTYKETWITADQAYGVLLNASQLVQKVGFENVVIDRPPGGTLFVFATNPGDLVPGDDG